MKKSIQPGKVWLDNNGKRIQAHGGALFFENNTYYWYGENKENTDGFNSIWTSGIRFYSSKDLYNWIDEGVIIPPGLDEDHPLNEKQRIDRPHLLFNEKTGKYVMWLKTSGEKACFTILSSDKLLGSYTLVKKSFRPLNKKVGDFDLAKDETSQKAYLYFDGDHKGMISVELTDDYLDVTNNHTIDFTELHPPFTREAMAHFERNGKHYMITSGMTGYIPNPSEVAVSDNWLGPYNFIGNPHVNDDSYSSFNSQISYVFKHPKITDFYIALADRWIPDFPVTKDIYYSISRAIGSHFNPDQFQATKADYDLLQNSPLMKPTNTSISDYVWLPIKFKGDEVLIEWLDEWHLPK